MGSGMGSKMGRGKIGQVIKSDFKKSCCYYYQGSVYAQVEKNLIKCDFERKWLILSIKKT